MLKLLSFIPIIISINCVKHLISAEDFSSDREMERAFFDENVKPINRVRHAGDLPLLTASELKMMLDGIDTSIKTLPKTEPNLKPLRELISLKTLLSFRLKYHLYKPENSEEEDNAGRSSQESFQRFLIHCNTTSVHTMEIPRVAHNLPLSRLRSLVYLSRNPV